MLVFDEGSVLPASSGNPEVTIPAQVVQQLMEGRSKGEDTGAEDGI